MAHWAFADPVDGETGAAFQNEGTTIWEGFSATDASHLTDAFAFTMSKVPIPAAILLFCSGLLGLMGIAGRRKLIHSLTVS